MMIKKDTLITDLIKDHPETTDVFEKHGLGCMGCKAALFENIEQGAAVHNMDTETLLNILNDSIKKP